MVCLVLMIACLSLTCTPSYLGSQSCIYHVFFSVFFFLNCRTSFQRERILEAHSHRFVTDFGSKAVLSLIQFDDLKSYSILGRESDVH